MGPIPDIDLGDIGHHSTAFTLDVYSHVVPGMQRQAAERLARLVLDSPDDADLAHDRPDEFS